MPASTFVEIWKSYSGDNLNYCTSCGHHFASVAAFDRHRIGKHAYTYAEGLAMTPARQDGRRCMAAPRVGSGLRLALFAVALRRQEVGIRAVWLNRSGDGSRPRGVQPWAEVRSLRELPALLG